MENIYSEPEIKLTQKIIDHLENIRKWTLFLSIVGFVFVFLMIVIAFFFGYIMTLFPNETNFQPVTGVFVSVIYVVIGIIHFFPVFYLYRFSIYIKRSLRTADTFTMEKAFSSLQTHYTIIGILTALLVGIYILIIVIAAIVALVT